MSKKVLQVFLILLILQSGNVFAQEQIEEDWNQPKGIHQIEWEQHKDYKASVENQRFKVQGPRVDLAVRQSGPSKEVFGYLPYWAYSNYSTLNYNLLTTVAYFGVEVNSFGQIVNKHDWPATALINKAHSEGVRVVLTVFLFNPNELSSLLGVPERRTTLINNLLTEVQSANADGVNIDFERVPSGEKENLTAFMTELTEVFHTNLPGSFVTIFTPSVDWSNVFDYFNLANITDGLVIGGYDYHSTSSPTAGPVAPLTGDRWGFYNVNWTVLDYLSKTLYNTSKLILGLPFYGREWPTQDGNLSSNTLGPAETLFFSEAIPNAEQYGRLWDEESQTPWYKYNDGTWHQGWYDDSLSMAKKFDLVNQEDLKGIAIWALSYDGERQEMQQAISDAFGSTAAPLSPPAFFIKNTGEGEVQISAQPSAGATSYKIYQSLDGENFDEGTTFPGITSTLSNLVLEQTYYFKFSALNPNGESNLTEVLTVRPSTEPVNILIVNGFDRTTGTVNTFDFVKRFAPAIDASGYAFDSGSNEAVLNGSISLNDYTVVLWISGEEGTANESFSNTEQSLIADFLEGGGSLFISGSEIGYDLVGQGSATDKTFYSDYFKAQYIRDQVATYTASGTDGIFSSISTITFDNGTHGTYNVDYPDGIKPVGGAILNISYDGFSASTYGGAGIQYAGTFGSGSLPGKLVYLAFPFETIYPETTRTNVMAAVLNFFELVPTSVAARGEDTQFPDEFRLESNYPNPFNPSTTISFNLPTPSEVTLAIFNAKGQLVRQLVNKRLQPGKQNVMWHGKNESGILQSSGVYFVQLRAVSTDGMQTFGQTQKITLLK